MLLKSIEFNDFRPFIGKQTINFECSKDKNVIVLLGDNTHGKSTLVLSFLWCFYGESKFEQPDDILNRTVEDKMNYNEKRRASVKVCLMHNEMDYEIAREQTFTKQNNGYLQSGQSYFSITYVDENGETKKIDRNDLGLTISSILPRELMPYFFFEGEKSNNLSTKRIGEAIKTLIGHEALAKMMFHLHGDTTRTHSHDSVMGSFKNAQNNSKNVSAQNEYDKKLDAEKQLEKISQRKAELVTMLSNYEEKIEEIHEKLLSYKPTRELHQTRGKVDKDKKNEENILQSSFSTYIKSFNEDSYPLFLSILSARAKERLKEMDIDDKVGIKGIEGTAITELLKNGECLCGTTLQEGTSAYKNVESYLNFLPPVNIGSSIREMLDVIEEYSDKSKKYISNFKKVNKDIQYSIDRINDYERQERAISEEIKKMDPINIEKIEEELERTKERIKQLRSELSRCEMSEGSFTAIMNAAANNFDKLIKQSQQNKKYQLYFAYAEELYNAASEKYKKKEGDLKTRLREIVAELFENMYSGDRVVEIDDNYNLKITVNGKTLSDTGGLSVIKYFSFVGGLIKLAREEMEARKNNNDLEMYGEEYPLVLDAAFSHADEGHVKSISEQLSTVTSQLVFAVMKKDWNYVEEGIKNQISRVYNLKKINEQEVLIQEV